MGCWYVNSYQRLHPDVQHCYASCCPCIGARLARALRCTKPWARDGVQGDTFSLCCARQLDANILRLRRGLVCHGPFKEARSPAVDSALQRDIK